jgi:hypothetical protein
MKIALVFSDEVTARKSFNAACASCVGFTASFTNMQLARDGVTISFLYRREHWLGAEFDMALPMTGEILHVAFIPQLACRVRG